jgi:DNA-binding MurR/RpiR family transcriptional regulator
MNSRRSLNGPIAPPRSRTPASRSAIRDPAAMTSFGRAVLGNRSTAFELLHCASAADAVLAVSFTPYNSITQELAASAAQRAVSIVSLTDSAFSPLLPVWKAYVEVIEESFSGFKSLSATLAVAMALVLCVERRRAEAASRARDLSSRLALSPVRRRPEPGDD